MKRIPGASGAFFLAVALLTASLVGCKGESGLRSLLTATLTPLPTASSTPSPSASFTAQPNPTQAETSPAPSTTPMAPSASPTAPDMATATQGPSPTASQTASITPTATRTRVPSRTPTNTFTPTITPTPAPPIPQLLIRQPGLLSRVTSPIQAEVLAVPGNDGQVRVELIGEDGRTLYHDDVDMSAYLGRSIAFYPAIPFQIQSMAETARLQVSTYDGNGRTIGLASVELVLLAVGRSEIFAADVTREPYALWSPKEGQEIHGGVLRANGLMRPVNDSPVTAALVSEDGRTLVSLAFDPPAPGGGDYTPFAFELPYQVDGPTVVRLTLSQADGRIPGLAALTSRTIQIAP